MITRDNITEVIDLIGLKKINKAINKDHDFIRIELHIFNTGSYATIKSLDYSEKKERKAHESGILFCDKDSFLGMCNDLGIEL